MVELQTVTIQKGTSKNLTKLDLEQDLSVLRQQLIKKDIMVAGDLFQFNGADIKITQEADFSGKEILKDGVITLKSSQKVKPGQTPNTPDTKKLLEGDKSDTLKLEPDVHKDPTKDVIKPDSGIATTDHEVEYISLSPEDRKKLFDRLQLFKAINMTSTGFEKCFPDMITWQNEPDELVPENTLVVDKSFSFSKVIHELRKRGVRNVKASGGGYGVAISAEYKQDKESLSRQETTKAYLLTTYSVPKAKLSIPIDKVSISQEFEKEVRNAIAIKNSTAAYFRLLNVLNKYGFYIPTVFTLGGQIYAEDIKDIQSTTEAESKTESFAVALETNLTLSGVPVNIGGGYGQSDSKKETDARLDAAQKIHKQVRGGDPAKSNESAKWIASLGPYSKWAVIEYVELIPTIKFLDPLNRNKCTKLINQHFLSSETQKKTVIDMGSYASSLMEDLVVDF